MLALPRTRIVQLKGVFAETLEVGGAVDGDVGEKTTGALPVLAADAPGVHAVEVVVAVAVAAEAGGARTYHLAVHSSRVTPRHVQSVLPRLPNFVFVGFKLSFGH